jgi:DNA primase catalytic core
MKSDPLRGVKTLKVGGFLDEFEKDAVKEKVDIVSLFSHFGVVLEKKGKSHTGLCPFHDDKNPSLSVDRQKGLYNCFGCGESGDVFDLVQRIKGIPFTEALIFLKDYSGNGKMKKVVRKEEGPSLLPDEKKPELPEIAEESQDLPGISLTNISEHYQKTLYKHPDALNYLKSRGFSGYELYKRFGIGFTDGSLLSLVSEAQKEALKGLGILNGKGVEHFSECLTIPLFDESGQVVSFYGRAIDTKRKVKHLYSPGTHKGLVNRKAAKVYREEIILTESVLDALSLIGVGIENVIPCYGVNGFTDDHLKALKDNRVKTLVLAFDADEAGRKGAEKLREKLTAEGFPVKVIEPASSKEGKKSKDWNEALTKGVSKESVLSLTANAEISYPEEETPEAFTARREGPKHLFTIADVTYRLLGVKELFVSSLRVNIRAEKGEERFFDNVDLYSARSRTVFAAHLADALGLEKIRIEKDLLRIVEYLEEERDKKLSSDDSEMKELTEEERKLGMELLTDPQLFERIVKDTETLGYSSRKLDDPVSVIVVSQSASGKSMLIDTIRRLMPEEDVVNVSSLSDQALNYFPEGGLLHKFLVMGEAVHSEVVDHQIREMLSAHELSRLVTIKDEKTGNMASKMVKRKTIVSMMMSTTDHSINPENASRCFVINTDESKEQTERIHSAQKEKYSLERYSEKRNEVPLVIKRHRAAQRLLENSVIVNPFGKFLNFPKELMRTRRDNDRFIDLIACVCFLRQFQKEEKRSEDKAAGEEIAYIECDIEDYRVAWRITVHGVLTSTYSDVPSGPVKLYEELRKLCRETAESEGLKVTEVTFSQREVRERVRWIGSESIKKYLRVLASYEYILREGGVKRGQRSKFRLIADEAMEKIDVSMIPTPQEMERLIAEAKVGNLQNEE